MGNHTTPFGESNQTDWQGAMRRLRFLMETNRVLVQDLADDLGVKKVFLQEVLDGTARPTESFLRDAARQFGVTVEFLLAGQSIAVPRPAPRGTRKHKGRAALKDLAVRHQALIELLIEKGIITAASYHAAIQRVDKRRD